jgi:hypothetical protein
VFLPRRPLIAALACFALALATAQGAPYAEERDDQGNLRPAYVEFSRMRGHDVLNPPAEAAAHLETGHPLGDQIGIFSLPLVLTGAEYRGITNGLAQRTQAFVYFFSDLVMGEQLCLQENGGFIPRVLVEQLVRGEGFRDLAHLRDYWAGRGPEDIWFLYGPDLMRDSASGQWTILEDNFGNPTNICSNYRL